MKRENIRSISELLTVVIPSKNEGHMLYECLYMLSLQEGIEGTHVVVADSSNEERSKAWLSRAKDHLKERMWIEVIPGGYPAAARLMGSTHVKTDYVLFLDADMILKNPKILKNLLEDPEGLDLMTVTIETDKPYDAVYKAFYATQLFSKWVLRTPFAIGGFQLWNTEAYWNTGGWKADELFAEDYSLSRKVKPGRFLIEKVGGVYTSPRRFKNKGVAWMVWIMLKSYLNRNNPEFFKRSHGYWD